MRRQSFPLFSIVLALAACAEPSTTPTEARSSPSSEAAKNRPPTSNVDVATTLYDTDGGGNPLFTRSDDRTGQGFATYTPINKISSRIAPDGGWQLYLGNQTARTVYLVLASQGIPAPDGYYASNVEVYSGCFDDSGARVNLLGMAAGTSNGNCSFGLDFSSGRTKYKLAMGPTSAGTGRATVTCNAAPNGACTSWTIVPNNSAANATVANLYHYTNNGGLVFDGAYHNAFHVEVLE